MSKGGVSQNPVPRVNIKTAGNWMSITLNMLFIGLDP